MLEVHIEKGMQHGQKIVFQGEADEAVSLFCPFILVYILAATYSSILVLMNICACTTFFI